MKISGILIGVPQYDNKDIEDLPYCSNDVEELSKTIKDNIVCDELNLLKINGTQISHTSKINLLKKIKSVSNSAIDSDLILFYFSGHGVSINNKGYLITSDSDLSILQDSAISIERIKEIFIDSRVKNKVIIIDSCFSGIHFGKNVNNNSNFIKSLDMLNSEGWTILSSSTGQEFSHIYEEKEMSVYTYFLINGLKGEAANDDNKISLEQINSFITRQIANWSLSSGKSQTPTIQTARAGTFCFRLKNKIKLSASQSFSLSNTELLSLHLSSNFNVPKGYNTVHTVNLHRMIFGNGANDSYESKWIDYTEKERYDILTDDMFIKSKEIMGKLVKFFNPSEIVADGPYQIIFPFGKLVIISNDFHVKYLLVIDSQLSSQQVSIFLHDIDAQEIIDWNSILYNYSFTFDLDIISQIAKSNNLTISGYDPFSKSIEVNFLVEEDYELKISFQNNSKNGIIEIKEKYKLRSDFFESLPIEEMLDVFKNSFIR